MPESSRRRQRSRPHSVPGRGSYRPGSRRCFAAAKACLDLDATHIESLCDLEALPGEGKFAFIGLPMKWRGDTASPIRAVAVFDM